MDKSLFKKINIFFSSIHNRKIINTKKACFVNKWVEKKLVSIYIYIYIFDS